MKNLKTFVAALLCAALSVPAFAATESALRVAESPAPAPCTVQAAHPPCEGLICVLVGMTSAPGQAVIPGAADHTECPESGATLAPIPPDITVAHDDGHTHDAWSIWGVAKESHSHTCTCKPKSRYRCEEGHDHQRYRGCVLVCTCD